MKASETNSARFRIHQETNKMCFRCLLDGLDSYRAFCTGPSIGNQVDGLRIDLNEDAVSASCTFLGRAPICVLDVFEFFVESS